MGLQQMNGDSYAEEPISKNTALIYGQVTTVKPIPTRQVTQIIIEIPEEHHIAATQLLFKRNAFIMPCADKSPLAGVMYGVTTLGNAMTPTTQTPSAIENTARTGVNPAKWLAIKGSDPNFLSFLGAATPEEAAQIARTRCGVQSRADIESSPEGLKAFMDEIYLPFTSRFGNVRRFSPSGVMRGQK